MYLEILAGSGVIGLAALLWLAWTTLAPQVARLRHASADRLMPATALLAASLLIAAHGLVDSFLSFTTTYLTFALVGGLAFARFWDCAPDAAPAPVAPDAPDAAVFYAHRV